MPQPDPTPRSRAAPANAIASPTARAAIAPDLAARLREEEQARLRHEDMALVRSIRRGDSTAWPALLARYQHKLFALCVRMTPSGRRDWAEDFAQEAMVKIIQGLDSYDGRSRLTTWMYRVVMNVCLSRLRSEKYRRHASLDAPVSRGNARGVEGEAYGRDLLEEPEPDAAQRVEHQEDRQRVLAALARLDPEQRAILLLRDARGLDYDEIADVLGLAIGTVKSRLFRAREALRQSLEQGRERDD